MDITDSQLQSKAAWTIESQASVFTSQANIFAPLYRQMNMNGLSLSESDRDSIMAYGMHDIWRALRYYLEHLNEGRPFILAGHSQGSNILTELMVSHWGGTGAEDRLIAGYLIGWSITADDLEENRAIKICSHEEQTGCFISYNSVSSGKQGDAPTILPGAIVVNPLSWKADAEFAPADLNQGAVFFSENTASTPYPNFTSAQAVDFGLVVEPADLSLVSTDSNNFPEGVYHIYDYSLFFTNLQENVSRRIETYATRSSLAGNP